MHGKRKAGLRSAMQDLQQKDSDLIYEHAMAGEKRDARAGYASDAADSSPRHGNFIGGVAKRAAFRSCDLSKYRSEKDE
ncbi:unnamed protein product [Fusarium graminearum]|uniref:Chromosome 1, complete genome n=2 Tax=Gibberella zeae TaxID=5518 RepID=A0A0E0RW65_GIBZE|nr:hypothetical protein FG05_30390 [Fusarium graminearum]CAF3564222.1 unnamed protein product [Fusarium graminearum]CAF3608532.1 unnamed protein product [Fusarium graminearum]CAF3614353.1 unnamed protein product [Fusarium graminearum]CAG1968585.1 unnamed protein product [Fusarium graminearum]